MRAVVTIAFAAVLVSCSPPAPAAAPEAEAAAEVAAAPAPAGEPMSTGEMGGMSNTAMSITGSLTVEPTALTFGNGFAVQTEYLGVVDATSPITEGGDAFAAAASRNPPLRVELRRIVGAAPEQLCGGQAATHVALLHDEPLTGLSLVAFSGADAPGPGAHDSAVCATYLFGVD
jgi:hypothetical protein